MDEMEPQEPSLLPDELFEQGTPENHEALDELRDLLLRIGYHVHRRSPNESTLRVYLDESRRYPLLNPRFSLVGDDPDSGSADSAEDEGDIEALVVTVLSRGGIPEIDDAVKSFDAPGAIVIPRNAPDDDYVRHGWVGFAIPVAQNGDRVTVDFNSLMEPWTTLRNHSSIAYHIFGRRHPDGIPLSEFAFC